MRTEISDDLKAAMKSGDKRRVSTLRLILAAIKERDIAARAEDRCQGVSDDEILQILTKMVKQRKESAQTYEEAGRADLALQENEESKIVESYLPRQLGADEVRGACNDIVGEIGASGLKDMGKCMGELKTRYAGQMDFSLASKFVKELLTQA
jgi:hypothetical protein